MQLKGLVFGLRSNGLTAGLFGLNEFQRPKTIASKIL